MVLYYIQLIITKYYGSFASLTVTMIYYLSFIALPCLLVYGNLLYYFRRNRVKFLAGLKHTLLELKLPKETNKSPKAVELMLSGFFNTNRETGFYAKYIVGGTRPWNSLEIVSDGGKIHFYVFTEEKFRNGVEAAIYSQFPDIEINEVEDYTKEFIFNKEYNDIWGTEYKLAMPDPYPIKTYVDFGLDKDPKEEYKVDPLAHIIEYFGTIKKGEKIWLQYVIRAHKSEHHKHGTLLGTEDWKVEAAEVIREIKEKALKEHKELNKEDKEAKVAFTNMILSETEKETISSIERSISKQPFDVVIRCIYLYDQDKINTSVINGVIGLFKPFNSQTLNSLGIGYGAGFDTYPWDDYNEIRKDFYNRKILQGYRIRGGFHPPIHSHHMVLTTEEIATLFHFPGSALSTPTVSRLPSKKSEPPTNLPI